MTCPRSFQQNAYFPSFSLEQEWLMLDSRTTVSGVPPVLAPLNPDSWGLGSVNMHAFYRWLVTQDFLGAITTHEIQNDSSINHPTAVREHVVK